MELLKGLNTKVSSLSEEQLRELISGQLRFREKKFEDVMRDPDWRSNNSLSHSEFQEWIDWGVNYLVKEHHMEEKEAQIQISWMELKWGLKVA